MNNDMDSICIDIIEQLLILLKNDPEHALITYGSLSEKINRKIGPRNLDYPLGIVSDVCKELGMPLLSTIVVNKKSYMPGEGYFTYYYPDVKETEYDNIFKRNLKEVREYQHWDEFAEAMGIKI
ncbi:hypothetical protein [Ruminiclostridium cellobioparum]|uniref:Uncharacterized protein n=1 Tax=Ruminiclostridium cellobioparum subsp. termitidis CT1112 TaxID=1195236 RepID=S0FY38_RUMCE|nr:hypothetical protein [Ruminiclostridium cellobioparum]EMS74034.1 hypothetical protein CTER_5130 [Ruminiclostridium cellobioparum subsp. termitidis CT1112]